MVTLDDSNKDMKINFKSKKIKTEGLFTEDNNGDI